MAWFERAGAISGDNKDVMRPVAFDVVSFVLGFCAGISHEQVVATCVTYCALVMFPVSRRFLLERETIAPPRVWVGAVGVILGAAVLVCAPSNFTRMAIYAAPSLKEIAERMVLFLSGAYFDMGTETIGKYIWLGALVFILLFFNRDANKREVVAGLKRGMFWWIISVVSLLAMAPATNFISTRTAFFAVIFLYVGIAAMMCRPQSFANQSGATDPVANGQPAPRLILSTAVLTALGCLVLVESVATLISNASVAGDVAKRDEIVIKAMLSTASGDKSPIRVPFIATQTAPLTYIQNPQHDSEFLFRWGKAVGRTIEHDRSAGAPLPNSLNPLKAIKFRHKD